MQSPCIYVSFLSASLVCLLFLAYLMTDEVRIGSKTRPRVEHNRSGLHKEKQCLVGVFSVHDRVDRRMLLRSTYMRHHVPGVSYAFVLGGTQNNTLR